MKPKMSEADYRNHVEHDGDLVYRVEVDAGKVTKDVNFQWEPFRNASGQHTISSRCFKCGDIVTFPRGRMYNNGRMRECATCPCGVHIFFYFDQVEWQDYLDKIGVPWRDEHDGG
jgi:hypothetical protein